ncbi:hypothetical protein G7081_03600 [Vagococcus coleopterorum]|uniref:Uncharacterized protein n=1 Tax=Vagococcus coleopterorum TaxID=2714946 RepID=A0A6G8AMM2_9ENTE|nr:hypothetical protein [Vagococcus coleopterorum]QIL46220.1 hypothetical protein G7081_03600 [Vagococcus coleopterorum]
MKIQSKKYLTLGILYGLLTLFLAFTLRVDNTDVFSWLELFKSLFFLVVTFCASAYHLVCAFSAEALEEEQIEKADERNNLINDKTNAVIGRICFISCLLFAILFLGLWGFFQSDGFLWTGILFAVIFNLLIVISIFVERHYEKTI